MTGLTGRSRRYMVSRFTFGCCTVMTAGTARGDTSVVKCSASKRNSRFVASFASGGGGDVVG